jgi:hypothetical protein
MGSVLEERHQQAAQACHLLQQIPVAAQTHDWTAEEIRDRTQKILGKIEELCVSEILSAVLSDWVAAGLCGVYVVVEQKPPYTIVRILREDPEIIYTGIRRAASSVAVSGVQFHEHVEACVANNIAEESAELVKELRQLKSRALLELCTTATLGRVGFVIEHLGDEQINALSRLLYRELGDKPRLLPMDRSPTLPTNPTVKQRYAWLHWYLWCREMHKPERQRVVGGVPQVVAIADGDRMLVNRSTGQPADPLGPIHAPVWRALGRELNKRGHPIKDPESENRIAKSIGVSRDKLRTFPRLPIKITPDGKGHVRYEYTGEDLLKAIEASSRKKPGRTADS